MRHHAFALVLCVIGITGPDPAAAWGDEGHEIVADIAYARLLPAARKKVDTILASDPDLLTAPDFVSRSTWADRYRDSDRSTTQTHYLATRAWHFADIEIDGGSIGAACPEHPPVVRASQGPADDCVVHKLDEFTAELGDPATPIAEKRLALKFLLHFVGDVHQPLHAADDRDAGGNGVRVLYPGIQVASNLHAYWDNRLVRLLGEDAHAVAQAIASSISAAEASVWSTGSPVRWAIESNETARSVAYLLSDQARATDSKGAQAIELSSAYDARALPVVCGQLARAGVRLASILNRVLR